MNKQEFLEKLRKELSGLPREDIEEWLKFYSEMIDDRLEEGILEEDAVVLLGDVSNISANIIAETPVTKIVKSNLRSARSLKTFEIVLLILGSPVWFSLLIAAFAILICVYVSVWAVIISLWAVEVSFAAGTIAGIIAGIIFSVKSNIFAGLFMFAASLVTAALSIFGFFGFKAATKGILWLTKKMFFAIKNCFIKKEES